MLKNIKILVKSFSHAFDGLAYVMKRERNFQIEVFFAILVLVLILILDVKNWEAVVLILMIAVVLVTELANTVVERVVDMLKPKIHPYARVIKDIMAAVVLISSFVATIIGVIIFYPYFKEIMGI